MLVELVHVDSQHRLCELPPLPHQAALDSTQIKKPVDPTGQPTGRQHLAPRTSSPRSRSSPLRVIGAPLEEDERAFVEQQDKHSNFLEENPFTPRKTEHDKGQVSTNTSSAAADTSPSHPSNLPQDSMVRSCIVTGLSHHQLEAESRRELVQWLAKIRVSETLDGLANMWTSKEQLAQDLAGLQPPKSEWLNTLSAIIDQAERAATARDDPFARQAINERRTENQHATGPLTTVSLPGFAPHVRNIPKATERWSLRDVTYPSDAIIKVPVTHPILALFF